MSSRSLERLLRWNYGSDISSLDFAIVAQFLLWPTHRLPVNDHVTTASIAPRSAKAADVAAMDQSIHGQVGTE